MTKENATMDYEYSGISHGHALRSQDPQTIQELINFEAQLEFERTKCLKKLNDYVTQIKEKLNSLKAEVHGDFSMEIRDADYYRVSMFQLEGKITQLKQTIKVELINLMKDENEVSRELHSIERRVDEWSKPINTRTLRPVVSAYRVKDADENNVTADFQKFLGTSGGHTGGWEEQDHLLFLRERRKYNGKQKFISAVHCLLPDISESEVMDHETWYQKYEELKNRQKEAIRKWRASRHSSLEKKESSMDERDVTIDKPKSRSFAGQRDITDRIKEWKRQQLIKKAEEETRQREEQHRQQEERLRKREIHKAKKSAVEHYKNEKLGKLQAEMLSQQMKELQALEDRAKKSVLLKAFREQDEQFMERKKMQKFHMELRERQRLERLQNVKPSIEVLAERDPQRLLQPTQGWTQKCQQQETVQAINPAISLHTIPHLAVPTWRRGLNTQTL